MTVEFAALMHALEPLNALKNLQDFYAKRDATRAAERAMMPPAGLDSVDSTFVRHLEEFNHAHRWDFRYDGPGPSERVGDIVVTGCTLVARGKKLELPLDMFSEEALDDIRDEIVDACQERHERDELADDGYEGA